MKRREFIAGLGAAVWPVVARARQDGRVRRIGWLDAGAENDPGSRANRVALLDALTKLGWIEGRNLQIERRFGVGSRDLVRAHAVELVGLAPDVIVTVIGAAAQAAIRQTQTIPIVFVGGPDALAGGLVQNIARPEGNITGFSSREPAIAGKCLELLKEAAPLLPAARRRGDRMSNCDLVAGRSLIDLVGSRPKPRLARGREAPALTRPNQSAQRLSSDRHGVPTVKVVGPNDVITNHGIEHGDHLAHDRNDHDLRRLASALEALTERLEHRIPIACAHPCHVEHLTDGRTTAPDATFSLELATLERIGRDTNQCSDFFADCIVASGGFRLRLLVETSPSADYRLDRMQAVTAKLVRHRCPSWVLGRVANAR